MCIFGPKVYIPSNTCIFWTNLLNVILISDYTFSKVSIIRRVMIRPRLNVQILFFFFFLFYAPILSGNLKNKK